MSKKEFLEKLERKLHILSREEIQDILDEYSGFLDNKIAEGKTEEEAVADFGNLDDLAREILSAYKINENYTRDKSRDIIDSIVESLTQGIDAAVNYFTQHFNELSVEAVIRLIALLLIALVVVAVLKLPFALLESIVTGLLSMILPNFLAIPLNWILSLAVNLIYLCLMVLLVVSVIQQGLENKDITLHDLFRKPLCIDFNVLLRRTEAGWPRRPSKSETAGPVTTDKTDSAESASGLDSNVNSDAGSADTKESSKTGEDDTQPSRPLAEEQVEPLIRSAGQEPSAWAEEWEAEAQSEPKKKAGFRPGHWMARLIVWFSELILILIASPFFVAMLACCVAFGILVFLLIQGAKLFGLTLICAGIIGILSAVVSAAFRLIKPSPKKKHTLISLIASAVLCGSGIPLAAYEFSRFTEIPLSQDYPELAGRTVKAVTFRMDTDHPQVEINAGTSEYILKEDGSLASGEIRVSAELLKNDILVYNEFDDFDGNRQIREVFLQSESNDGQDFRNQFNALLRALREQKLYRLPSSIPDKLVIEANAETLAHLSYNSGRRILSYTE